MLHTGRGGLKRGGNSVTYYLNGPLLLKEESERTQMQTIVFMSLFYAILMRISSINMENIFIFLWNVK